MAARWIQIHHQVLDPPAFPTCLTPSVPFTCQGTPVESWHSKSWGNGGSRPETRPDRPQDRASAFSSSTAEKLVATAGAILFVPIGEPRHGKQRHPSRPSLSPSLFAFPLQSLISDTGTPGSSRFNQGPARARTRPSREQSTTVDQGPRGTPRPMQKGLDHPWPECPPKPGLERV